MDGDAFLQLTQSRRSWRAYTKQAITPEQIQMLLQSACSAPSAGNIQPWHFFVLQGAARKRLFKAALDRRQGWMMQAPVWIAVVARPQTAAAQYHERGAELYCLQDTAAAAQNILLCAHAMGLGTGWVGAFCEEAAEGILGLGADERAVAIIAVGHPDGQSGQMPRDPVNEVTSYIDT